MHPKRIAGNQGESLAIRFLERQGYKILETNYQTRMGEIDIIARERKTIVFVEVKYRSSDTYGGPKCAVTPAKQAKLCRLALHYLKATRQLDKKARFDVVAIHSLDLSGVELIRNAFECSSP